MTGSTATLHRLRADRITQLFAPATIDVFAGMGGFSIGAEQAYVDGGYRDRYIDLMINHWDVAVGVHQANHPLTEHLQANVLEVDPDKVLMGRQIVHAHLSPDCTDHSKAKGGKPKRKEIRALADVVIVWAGKRRPAVITLENVEEFEQWGPLLPTGMPDKRRRGQEFQRWVRELLALGYAVEWRQLRACDYGAPTTRKRLFVIARCDGLPIVWPEKTHGAISNHSSDQKGDGAPDVRSRGVRRAGRDGQTPSRRVGVRGTGGRDFRIGRSRGEARELKPFRTAAECIDWSIPMLSIFATPAEAKAFSVQHGVGVPRRPLKPKTLERIARGLVKFVINAKRPFIVHIENSTWDGNGTREIDVPLNTITATPKGGKHAVVDAKLAPYTVPNLGERDGQAPRCGSIADPMPTVTAKGNCARLVAATLQTLNHTSDHHRAQSPADPLHTVTGTRDARACVAALLTKHYGGHETPGGAVDAPIDTVTAKDHNAVTVAYLNKHRGTSIGSDAGEPCPTITGGGDTARDAGAAHALGVTCAYLSHMYGTNKGTRGNLNEPASTVTGSSNHAALVSAFLSTYYGNSKDGHAISEPSPTVVSKDRIQLVTVTIDGQTYVITDIAMRMLRPRELARAQGFDDSYIIDRTADGTRISKSDQVKLIGNSVPPAFARAIVKANVVDQGLLEDSRELEAVSA